MLGPEQVREPRTRAEGLWRRALERVMELCEPVRLEGISSGEYEQPVLFTLLYAAINALI